MSHTACSHTHSLTPKKFLRTDLNRGFSAVHLWVSLVKGTQEGTGREEQGRVLPRHPPWQVSGK